MPIKGLVGKEGNTLGTSEKPWETLYVKNIEAEPVELTIEHKTGQTYKGKTVYGIMIERTTISTSGKWNSLNYDTSNIEVLTFNGITKTLLCLPYYISSNYYVNFRDYNDTLEEQHGTSIGSIDIKIYLTYIKLDEN